MSAGGARPPALLDPTLLDEGHIAKVLEAAIAAAPSPLDRRKAVVQTLQPARILALRAIEAELLTRPASSRDITTSYARLTDAILRLTHASAARILGINQGVTILAVGGYGRGEMALHSDIDLLFLTDTDTAEGAEAIAEEMLYILWDLKLKVGHATRTVKECLKLAKEDHTIRTTLVECRHLIGDEALTETLKAKLQKDLFASTAREFVEAKLAEREARHRKQGGQRYMVEPNVKEGKGGLRDLQSLFWIAKYIHGVEDAAELVGIGVFTQAEFDAFVRAEDFLWAVRCHLHVLAGRATEQLTFDMQVEVAERMGYVDRSGRRAVELFMQDYFRHATRVGELTRIFLTALEDIHVKREPMLMQMFRSKPRVPAPYAIEHNRITIADEAAFLADPLNMLRIFELALSKGTLLHPDAMRLIAANLTLIDKDLRKSDEARRIFLDLLLKHGNPERSLRRMNELGVLAAFVPEFEPIVAMMQFNMYHSYTVDEHTIQVISTL
ncbi:MAG: nucleotidyltransferase domain-containing protein, partial [Shimia sp.]